MPTDVQKMMERMRRSNETSAIRSTMKSGRIHQFNGKPFRFYGDYYQKVDAQKQAERLRQRGLKVRVIHAQSHSYIYWTWHLYIRKE